MEWQNKMGASVCGCGCCTWMLWEKFSSLLLLYIVHSYEKKNSYPHQIIMDYEKCTLNLQLLVILFQWVYESICMMRVFWRSGSESAIMGSIEEENMPSISALSASALVKEAFATLLMQISRITVQVRKEIESLWIPPTQKYKLSKKGRGRPPYQAALAFQGMTYHVNRKNMISINLG